MRLFDVNTALGHWPFRQVPCNTPSALRDLLLDKGITGAAAVNTHGLFYKNCHNANIELAEWIEPHGDFFVGVGTLNPTYAAWERDLVTCKQELGLRAIRLAPQYHQYRLGGPESLAIGRAAAELGLPVLAPHRVVDPRQRHWFDTEETIAAADVVSFCKAIPALTVIVTESPFTPGQLAGSDGAPPANLLLANSRLNLDAIPSEFAENQVVFGSGAPLKHITPAKLKLEISDHSAEVKQKIAETTALRVFDPS